mgnify:CR=1 FL=1
MCIRDRCDVAKRFGDFRYMSFDVVGTLIDFEAGLTGSLAAVSYTHLRAHETVLDLVCRLLLEKKKQLASYDRLHIDKYFLISSTSCFINLLRTMYVPVS